MKLAKVNLIHTSSDPCILNNYRPVSLLPVLFKLLQQIAFEKTHQIPNIKIYPLYAPIRNLSQTFDHSP